MPSPSGLEIANCLKYFSQVLLSKLETKYHIIIALFTSLRQWHTSRLVELVLSYSNSTFFLILNVNSI